MTNAMEFNPRFIDRSTPDPSIPDPWGQALGVFDLTAMEWKAGYDAHAAPYVTPDAIKAYYRQNGRYPASWTNDVVKSWFTTEAASNGTSNQTVSPASSQPGSPKSHTGAIVGGIIGGVVALAVIALGAFFSVRRRRRHRPSQTAIPETSYEYRRPELGNHSTIRPAGLKKDVRAEMPGNNEPSELDQKQVVRSELPSGEAPREPMATAVYEI